MINFLFNLTTEQARITMLPQNTFTEIDVIAAMCGIERYEGERYKDFYDHFNQVGIISKDPDIRDIVQIATRSNFFDVLISSKSTNYRYKVEITGNYDFNIEQNYFDGSSWLSTSTSYDLTNRKLYPYLHDVFLDVREIFPQLELNVFGIEEEGAFDVCGMNLKPSKNFRRDGFVPTDTMANFPAKAIPTTLRYDSTRFVLNTSSVCSTNGFYIDHHLQRFYCSTALQNNIVVDYDRIEEPFVIRGTKDFYIQPLYSTEAFVKMIQNNTFHPRAFVDYVDIAATHTSTHITGLNETPLFNKFFEQDIEMRYRTP